MNTPICDFVRQYREKRPVRLHMPGHKGRMILGPEEMDITEIAGADELYRAGGIIRESEENAARLFGAGKTLYSTEGSSLCIRAMVCLALERGKAMGRKPLILAGRNAHQAFLSACALLDAQVQWLYPETGAHFIACDLTGEGLEKALNAMTDRPAAVYVTSPDYLGNRLDIGALARVCHRHGTPLLVDNAHGAYLRFLPEDAHPLALGADLCCDSAHKTLPVLTGGAYLHIAAGAMDAFSLSARRAMRLFASTSPSYLILQSLDLCNARLAEGYRDRLAALAKKTADMKERLQKHGYALAGDEPIKLTIAAKAFGYTGDQLHDALRRQNMEGEFSDPDYLTLMLTPELTAEELGRLEEALLAIPRRAPIPEGPPALPRPERVLSIREAMLAPAREIPAENALGRVLADAYVGCPPCIPILACGERVDRAALRCFQYYGIKACAVVENAGET